MIKVLIVDDEKLVRKGIISLLPWQKHNMKVVGEATNGKNALEFMANHSVDLLFTDITMPAMSGIELIKIVKQEYPDTAIVILSCHQDFEYAQDALRVGAIDYIVKTQLEEGEGEEILSGIRKKLNNDCNLIEIGVFNYVSNTRHNYSEAIIRSIEKSVTYIRENIEGKITQSIVAKEINVSRAYFSQCFKDLVGKSFSEFVREEKVKKAKAYLLNTSKPVYWIARQIGFNDEKYFSRVFKDSTGLLPTEFRKK